MSIPFASWSPSRQKWDRSLILRRFSVPKSYRRFTMRSSTASDRNGYLPESRSRLASLHSKSYFPSHAGNTLTEPCRGLMIHILCSHYSRTGLTAHLISHRYLSGLVFVHPLTFRFVVGPMTVAKRQGNYKPCVRENSRFQRFCPGGQDILTLVDPLKCRQCLYFVGVILQQWVNLWTEKKLKSLLTVVFHVEIWTERKLVLACDTMMWQNVTT